MKQLSFSDAEYRTKKRKTRREIFLEQMDKAIPWTRIEQLIEPFYPKKGNGRPPYPLATMLRIHVMQHCYNLADEAMEEALYEIQSMRQFADLSLTQAIPDESTILHFRHLLEKHNLGEAIFSEITDCLTERGLFLKSGTIVDATIIEAPSSTKNKEKQRDPDMHQTKKGNQWYFGMKAHIGVDAETGTIHSLAVTSANHHDVTQADQLLHGEETGAFGDSGYQGVEKRPEHEGSKVNWHVSMKPGKRKKLGNSDLDKLKEQGEQLKSHVRSKVEHAFRIIKCQFGFNKARYRGMDKNCNQLHLLFALANIYQHRQVLA